MEGKFTHSPTPRSVSKLSYALHVLSPAPAAPPPQQLFLPQKSRATVFCLKIWGMPKFLPEYVGLST